jgi:uncharacterized protein involved in outer membrane biogenesis
MRAFLKFVLTGIGLVLILLGVAALLLFTQAQDFLGTRVGRVVSEALGSDARIGGVGLDPRLRAVMLKDVALKNPAGFKEGDALTCGSVLIVFSFRTLLTEQPAIHLVELRDTHIYSRYEIGQGTNLAALAKRYGTAPVNADLKFTVDKLVCEGAKLHLSTNLLPGASVPINLSKIEMVDLAHGKPITTEYTTSLFLRTLLKEVITVKGLGATIYDSIGAELKDLEKEPA